MHPEVFAAFDRICAEVQICGPVLEIGAVAEPSTLLNLPALARALPRVGINLKGDARAGGAVILRGSANAMSMFASATFAAVLCNATLEHDGRFWLTLAEINRVAAPGALVAIGVPGYAVPPPSRLRQAGELVRRLTPFAPTLQGRIGRWLAGTPTLGLHGCPLDYYRFSEEAVRSAFLAGCRDVRSLTILDPPRIIGWGRRADD